jgi:hypothetical protein
VGRGYEYFANFLREREREREFVVSVSKYKMAPALKIIPMYHISSPQPLKILFSYNQNSRGKGKILAPLSRPADIHTNYFFFIT